MRACPFAHTDNFLHNIGRTGIKRSNLFRWAAPKMVDFFCSRLPISDEDLPRLIPSGKAVLPLEITRDLTPLRRQALALFLEIV
jgi:hypothetical protein